MQDKKQHIEAAADAACNLNAWASVAAILEGGISRHGHDHKAVERVLEISRKQQRKHLSQYDLAVTRAKAK